jgi:GNAT superfamily N-acetyltransferase
VSASFQFCPASLVAVIQIERIGAGQLDELRTLWKADWLENHESDQLGSEQAAGEVDESLQNFDCFASDSFWTYWARADGALVGYATVVRIPKLDRRKLFLFVDELFVLKRYRRSGIASLLLQSIVALGKSLNAEGVRLIVNTDNGTARALYAANRFS